MPIGFLLSALKFPRTVLNVDFRKSYKSLFAFIEYFNEWTPLFQSWGILFHGRNQLYHKNCILWLYLNLRTSDKNLMTYLPSKKKTQVHVPDLLEMTLVELVLHSGATEHSFSTSVSSTWHRPTVSRRSSWKSRSRFTTFDALSSSAIAGSNLEERLNNVTTSLLHQDFCHKDYFC